MRSRSLAVAAAALSAVAAVSGLTACRTNAGAAAFVSGHRISETEVGGYIGTNGASADVVAQAAQQGRKLLPKTTVVLYLVQDELFTRVLAANGGAPGAAELAAAHDSAGSGLLGTQLTGADVDTQLAKAVTDNGFTSKFPPLVLRVAELEQILGQRLKATDVSQVVAAVKKAGVTVTVSPRYGKWDPSTLDLGDPAASLPSFLTLATPSAAAPGATG